MPELLRAVAGTTRTQFGILRISSSDGTMSGKLLIVNNMDIAGAHMADGSEQGYAAARKLLSVLEGNFAFLDVGLKRPENFDHELCLSITRTISSWPNLPELPGELFDEKGLLDKIFGSTALSGFDMPAADAAQLAANRQAGFGWTTKVALGARVSGLPAAATGSGSATSLGSSTSPGSGTSTAVAAAEAMAESDSGLKSVWTFMQPLFDTGPMKSFQLQDTSWKRGSLNNLRHNRFESEDASRPWFSQLFREAFLSRPALVCWGLGALLFALILVTSFTNASGKQNNSLKHNNSLTIHKGVTRATHL